MFVARAAAVAVGGVFLLSSASAESLLGIAVTLAILALSVRGVRMALAFAQRQPAPRGIVLQRRAPIIGIRTHDA